VTIPFLLMASRRFGGSTSLTQASAVPWFIGANQAHSRVKQLSAVCATGGALCQPGGRVAALRPRWRG